jgi:hypothetical protein
MRLMSRLSAALAGAAMAVTALVVAAPPALAAAATHFAVSMPGTVNPDQPVNVSVAALDAGGGVDYQYAGTVHFTSSDDVAILPPDYTFGPADGGQHTFQVTFRQQAIQTLKVSDIAKPAVTGQGETRVGNATTQTLSVDLPNGARYREPATIVVTAIDNLGRTDPGYRGSVHFTSTDNIATLPGDYQFTAADAGRHEFADAVMFRTQGPQRIHVQDAASPSIYGDREIVIGTYPTPVASATPTATPPAAPQPILLPRPSSGLSVTPVGRATPQGSRSLPFTGAHTSRLVAMGLALFFGGLLLLAGRTLRRASQT